MTINITLSMLDLVHCGRFRWQLSTAVWIGCATGIDSKATHCSLLNIYTITHC
jgi:hypothetical protein